MTLEDDLMKALRHSGALIPTTPEEVRRAEVRMNADKCLPCRGVGKRWIGPPSGYWGSCPDCKGTGRSDSR